MISPFTPSTIVSSPISELRSTDFDILAFDPTMEWLISTDSSTEPAPMETFGPIFDFFRVTLSSMYTGSMIVESPALSRRAMHPAATSESPSRSGPSVG